MSLVCPVGPEANLLEVGPEHCARLIVENPILTLEEMQVSELARPIAGHDLVFLCLCSVFPLFTHPYHVNKTSGENASCMRIACVSTMRLLCNL